jgi:hypothetical protein
VNVNARVISALDAEEFIALLRQRAPAVSGAPVG